MRHDADDQVVSLRFAPCECGGKSQQKTTKPAGSADPAQALLLCSPSAAGGDVSELIVRKGYALSAELVKLNSVLPNGWVFHEAENVAGFAKGTGPIRFDLNRRHSSMANVAWNPNGLVRATRSTSRSSAGPRHHGRPGRVGGRSPTP